MPVSELPAGTVDIPAHYSPNTNIYTTFFKFIFEGPDRFVLRMPVSPLSDGIDRNQIDMASSAESFTSRIREYSKVTCLPVRSK